LAEQDCVTCGMGPSRGKGDALKVLLIGVGRSVRILAGELTQRGAIASHVDSIDWRHMGPIRRLRMLRSHDLVHFYWGRRVRVEEVLACRLSGTRVIYTFVGSDVLRLREGAGWKRIRARLALCRADCVTAVAPWLSDELKALGIDSRFMPFAFVRKPAGVAPLPERFTVLTYVPIRKESFYGWDLIHRLALDFPDVAFSVVGHDGTSLPNLPNVRYHGWVKAFEPLAEQASVFLRLTRHDGLARTVLESLACCRHVLWTYSYPFCRQVKDYDTLRSQLRDLQQHPSLNEAGGRYVWERFSRDRILSDCLALYKSVLDRKAPNESPDQADERICGQQNEP